MNSITSENKKEINKVPNITFEIRESINKSLRGANLFSVSNSTLNSTKSSKTNDYVDIVNKEKISWHQLLKDTKKSIKIDPVKIDMSVLTETQREYCEQITNLNNFQKESIEFIKYANFYLQFVDSINGRKENLNTIIDGRINSKITDFCVDNIDLTQFLQKE